MNVKVRSRGSSKLETFKLNNDAKSDLTKIMSGETLKQKPKAKMLKELFAKRQMS